MNRWITTLQSFSSSNATDCILGPHQPTQFRAGGEWQIFEDDHWTGKDCDELCLNLLTEEQKHLLVEKRRLQFDFSHQEKRIRGLVFVTRGGFGFHFRLHTQKVPKLQELHLPHSLSDMFQARKGLIIVCGGAGKGKTTLLNALLNHEIKRSYRSVVNIAESIEFEFGQIAHIEVGKDIESAQLNELIPSMSMGEIFCFDAGFSKNLLEAAVDRALAGQLSVLAMPVETLLDGVKSVSRSCLDAPGLYDSFVEVFHGGISQTLLPGKPNGFEPGLEICYATPAIKQCLQGRLFSDFDSTIAGSGDKSGMRTLNQSLLQLVLRRKVDFKLAFKFSSNPNELDQMLNKAGI